MANEAQLTPMMAQYRRIKGELPKDALLLFRLGDFYEMFFEDAQSGAQLLNLALTARNGVPMCGLPFHAANSYIARILKAGRKVAICDQVEDARPGQLVKREVTQILSPGTHFDERLLAAERNNFLAAICPNGKIFGLALVDLTTGDFLTTEVENDIALLTELQRLRPAEIIFPGENTFVPELLGSRRREEADTAANTSARFLTSAATAAAGSRWIANGYDDWTFAPETALYTVRDHFKVASLDGFGLKDRVAAIGAAGGALHYLTQHLRRDVRHLTRLSFYQRNDFLALDYTTLRHLEILEPLRHDAPRNASLYGAINRTVTPMGARRLRDWLSQPLAAVEPIRQRQEAVQTFIENSDGLEQFRARLADVRDLERTLGRLSSGSANARDLIALRLALEQIPKLKETLQNVGQASRLSSSRFNASDAGATEIFPPASPSGAGETPALLSDLESRISESPDLVELLSRAIVDEPPLAVKEGGMIRDGFDDALDELRQATRGGKDWIAKLQADEIARTGIQSLKVRFNSVFGYYIEVTRANLDKVPPQYVRKQTIANGERFITPELKEMEGKILGAEERTVKLEYELFQRVREEVLA
jgi:DNA mismatch repair protein MutS